MEGKCLKAMNVLRMVISCRNEEEEKLEKKNFSIFCRISSRKFFERRAYEKRVPSQPKCWTLALRPPRPFEQMWSCGSSKQIVLLGVVHVQGDFSCISASNKEEILSLPFR